MRTPPWRAALFGLILLGSLAAGSPVLADDPTPTTTPTATNTPFPGWSAPIATALYERWPLGAVSAARTALAEFIPATPQPGVPFTLTIPVGDLYPGATPGGPDIGGCNGCWTHDGTAWEPGTFPALTATPPGYECSSIAGPISRLQTDLTFKVTWELENISGAPRYNHVMHYEGWAQLSSASGVNFPTVTAKRTWIAETTIVQSPDYYVDEAGVNISKTPVGGTIRLLKVEVKNSGSAYKGVTLTPVIPNNGTPAAPAPTTASPWTDLEIPLTIPEETTETLHFISRIVIIMLLVTYGIGRLSAILKG